MHWTWWVTESNPADLGYGVLSYRGMGFTHVQALLRDKTYALLMFVL